MNEPTIPPHPWQPWSCARASALWLLCAFLSLPIPAMAQAEPASQQQEPECTPISVRQTIVASLEQEQPSESVPSGSAPISCRPHLLEQTRRAELGVLGQPCLDDPLEPALFMNLRVEGKVGG